MAAAASAASLPLLPDPAIGTRLAYRLIYADARGGGGSSHNDNVSGGYDHEDLPSRYAVIDLGSVVVGEGGPALRPADVDAEKTGAGTRTRRDDHDEYYDHDHDNHDDGGGGGGGGNDGEDSGDGHKTLADARFVPGDYISCAVLPPLADGSVAPASDARTGRGSGVGEARPLAPGSRPPGGLDGAGARDRAGQNGFAPRLGARGVGDRGRSHRLGRGGGAGGHRGAAGGGGFPAGEWRRGERLPDAPPPGRGRDRVRW